MTFPDGQDIEIFSFKTLKKTQNKAKLKFEKEHVTPYMIKNNNFKKFYFKNKVDFSRFRWSLDEIDDLKVIEGIIKEFKPNIYFSWEEAMKKILTSKKLSYNEYLKRNEGSTMSKTSKLWRRAKKLIQEEICFYQKDLSYFIQNYGLHIIKKLKTVQYGI